MRFGADRNRRAGGLPTSVSAYPTWTRTYEEAHALRAEPSMTSLRAAVPEESTLSSTISTPRITPKSELDSNLFSNQYPMKIVNAGYGRFLKGDNDVSLRQAALSSRPVRFSSGHQYTLIIGQAYGGEPISDESSYSGRPIRDSFFGFCRPGSATLPPIAPCWQRSQNRVPAPAGSPPCSRR